MNQFRSHHSARLSDDKHERLSCAKWCSQVIQGDRKVNHTAAVLKLSVATNILIVLTMTAVAVASKSLALLSTLVENMVDLVVQGLLAYAGTRAGAKQDYVKFPAGTSRLEPVAVVVASSTMMILSVVFIQEGAKKLYDGFVHGDPVKPQLTVEALVISGLAISTKIFLALYCHWILRTQTSPAVQAIHDDNRNDVVSNSFATSAYIIASARGDLWYVDPTGAIVIFLLIMVAWGRMGKEQVMQLVGVAANDDFVNQVKQLCRGHDANLSLDILRAYHFGTKYLVELEVIVPGDMTVQDAHDIALRLQFKVEQLEDVERAFVHVDYQAREYDEHIVSREEDALLMYTRGDHNGETPRWRSIGGDTSASLEITVAPSGSVDDSSVDFHEMHS